MLVQYTSLSQLNADERARLAVYARSLGESNQPFVIFEGKTIKMAEVRTLVPAVQSQQLNG